MKKKKAREKTANCYAKDRERKGCKVSIGKGAIGTRCVGDAG
jgi:hypothetical protein